MIKSSLTRKLIVVFSAILVAVVALNIVINGLLLSKVYRDNKIDAMEELYKSLSVQYSSNSSIDQIIDVVKDTLSNENLRVFIWDNDNRLIIDSLPLSHEEDNEPSVPAEAPTDWKNNSQRFPKNENHGRDFRYGRGELFIFHIELKDEQIITKKDTYTIFSYESFDNANESTLCLRGYLPNDLKILIQLPIASMDEAVGISNALLLIVGIVMLVIGIIIVAVTSRNIAKPVKELSQIAKSMESLDFTKKYSSKRTDEIGSLGASINSLSEKLEATINELFEKNEKLRQDNELKNRIDIMRKEFIANASHELKTPVALISGYAEGLIDNVATDDESRKLYSQVIIEEAEKMNNIIHQMLDLMEIDSAESILDGRRFSLCELAEDVVSSFNLILKNQNIQLTYESEGDCPVFGEYFRIYQAVANYISNAINHVDENKIIRIFVKKTDDKVRFSVYNSGVSIPMEEIPNIWERFYKVDKAHTRSYGGTGLGLSIVRSVIELHGGEYGVINHSDGVEFYFTLNEETENEI